MHLPRYLTTFFFCAAGKRNHNLTKIPTPPLHTYCQVAVNHHIQMRASIGKQPNLYAWKQYMPLSYHSSPKNIAPHLNAHLHSKSNFRRGWPYLTFFDRSICTQGAEPNEEKESKNPLLDSKTKKELFKAIENNNIKKVETLLGTYKDVVTARDADKMTPFLHAAKEGHLEILKLLQEQGTDVYATDKDGYNALHKACTMGHFEAVNWLLNHCNMKLEAKDAWDEMTPLLFAAQNGHLDILKALKEAGADVYATDRYDRNALHEACRMGHFETANWLLNHCNMKLEAKDAWYKMTPFLFAAEKGHLDILKLLQTNGADIKQEDELGKNALHEACMMGRADIVIWLLNHCNMNLEAKDAWYKMTPFLFAAEKGHLDILKLLKANGANINAKDEDGHNALHFACMIGRTETVIWLLNHCNINLETKGGSDKRTPFLHAAKNGHLDILKLLKANGANVKEADKDNSNALHFACMIGRTETVRWLLNHCDINLKARGSFERTPFLCAAQKGHLDILKALKEAGADVNATDRYDRNALHEACRMGHFETANWLLNHCNMKLEAKDAWYKMTPLLFAAEKGHLDILKLLKANGANINAKDEDGHNALHEACGMGHLEIVRWLLNHCKINLETKSGWYKRTPFLDAAKNGHLDILKLLQKKGADVKQKDAWGNNALHLASKMGKTKTVRWLLNKCNIKLEAKDKWNKRTPFLFATETGNWNILKLLKANGANANAKDKDGNNALHLASKMGRIETARWLLNNCNINLEARGSFGKTPFLHAAKEGHLKIVKLLKKKGVDVYATDNYGNNALYLACGYSGSVEIVTWLLDVCKIDIEIKGYEDRTPFLHAAKEGRLKILKLLQEQGANVSATDNNGNNALHLACLMDKTETVKWLLYNFLLNLEAKDAWYKKTPFLCAAQKGHLDILKLLKEKGADVNATDKYGNNALHEACMMGRTETVNWLLDNCNINLEARGSFERTPFLFAAERGYLDILRALKKAGVDVSATDKHGNNALHEACSMGRADIVNWILDNCNINLEAGGSFGRTPFLHATRQGSLEILRLLKAYGANINATDEDGDNALHLAKYSGNQEVIRYLQSLGLH